MSTETVRQPAVAGQFYEGDARGLRQQIEACFLHRLGPGGLPEVAEGGPRRIIGLVSPHAGYMFSGPPAARGFHALAADGRPEVAVIIGPSHRRAGQVAVTQTAGAWRTPLGDMPIAAELAAAIVAASEEVVDLPAAHLGEHSLEVQCPFLQYIYGETLPIVPVMMMQQDLPSATAVGAAVAQASRGRDVAIIASTDMTHYESPEAAARRDQMLINRIVALDPDGLCREAMRPGMSMCGYGPVAAMLVAARALGATQAELLGYSNSGDVQRMPEVVGYLSVAIAR